MKLKYKSSIEKWEDLTRIALFQLNDEKLAWLCQDIADYIKSKCDTKLKFTIELDIENLEDFVDAIYDDSATDRKHPCPHCYKYRGDCHKCPLRGKKIGYCCDGLWIKVMKYLNIKRAHEYLDTE